eukprot:m.73071 g.73071  ORF g.73071 m.73071 type:complete len:88 (-) comp12355_c0_seq2:7-270(-)
MIIGFAQLPALIIAFKLPYTYPCIMSSITFADSACTYDFILQYDTVVRASDVAATFHISSCCLNSCSLDTLVASFSFQATRLRKLPS